MTTDTLNMNGRFQVRGKGAIAWWIDEPYVEQREVTELICEDPECDHETEACYLWDTEEIETNMVYAVMVGDDRRHLVDIDDLVEIAEDDYCGECGQIGCDWGAHDGD